MNNHHAFYCIHYAILEDGQPQHALTLQMWSSASRVCLLGGVPTRGLGKIRRSPTISSVYFSWEWFMMLVCMVSRQTR
eukprot:9099698-Pyramimonas_sp.AAC.1